MSFLYYKALHIIFVVTWFAGLFYIVRLFIYQTEAYQRDQAAREVLIPQLKLMSRRLWFGITWPSAILTLIFGLSLLQNYIPNIPGWLWIKLSFVAALYLYQFLCHKIFRQLQRDKVSYTSQQLRLWNEISSLFLVSIVFLVILRSALSMVWGILGLIAFAAALMIAVRIYKKLRKG